MKNDLHSVYIVLSMSGTKFSKFLRYFSHFEFTHVSISLDEGLSELYSFGRKSLRMPLWAGLVSESVDRGVFNKYQPQCEVLKLTLTKKQYNRLLRTLNKMRNNSSYYKYNFAGILFTYFNVNRKLHKRYTCTQFVAHLLDGIDIHPNNKHESLVLPCDYYDIENIKSIYKGDLKEYVYSFR